jgi:solute carrier family 25 (mitochondrial phosphate transporter), member 3
MRYDNSCKPKRSCVDTDCKGMATPIDVVKTRIQVDPSLRGKGMFTAARSIISSEGPAALLTGFGPTAVGYFVQGGMKFAGYEFFKGKLINATGSYDTAVEHRTAIYLTSAAIAEFFADIALCPLEATRIRLVSQRGFASGLTTGFLRILREDGIFRGFYSGFIPILFKQVSLPIVYLIERFPLHWVNLRCTNG